MSAARGVCRTVALILVVACRTEDEAHPRPLPDDLPVRRLAVLDSALSAPGIAVEYHWEVPDSVGDGPSVVRHRHPVTWEHVRLRDTVAFDLDGVETARLLRAGAGFMVTLKLSMPAGQRLLHTTSYHVGERIGVLVNGRLVTLATVRTPLTDHLPVLDAVPEEQARAVAERINARVR